PPFIQRISPLGAMAGRDVDVQLFGVNLPVNQVKVKIGRTAPNPIPIRVETNGLFSNVRMLSVSSLADRPEVEPNNQLEQAYAVTNSVWINGTIEQAGDQDWYSFTGRKGEKKTVEISARRLGSPLDARLTLMNATQTVLAVNDDLEDKSSGLLTHHADARIDFTLPENGTYFVRLDDLQRKGGPEYAYRLSISKEKQDFQLRLVPSSVCVPQGGHALVTVQAIRTGGFTGEIQLSLSDAPEGIELQRAVIPEGASSVQMMIAASDRVEQQLIALEIEGEAQCDSKTQRRRAVPAEDRMQAFLYRHWVPANDFLVRVSPPKPVTVTLDLPVDGVFHARPGSEIVIPASLTSLDKTRKGIQLMLVDPPEWLTLKTANLPMRSGRIVLEVSPNAEPDDTATVLLQGVVRIDKLPSDPDYMISPKGVNKTAHDFTIDALSIRITN
ncbi:MAG: hypothetical protein FJ220_05515, partial [Kiritimatiellaceae bacterium]|nr:hypothetical protein [Kiritimatiellaceae bacterium]